jgi:hypothetical protein
MDELNFVILTVQRRLSFDRSTSPHIYNRTQQTIQNFQISKTGKLRFSFFQNVEQITAYILCYLTDSKF